VRALKGVTDVEIDATRMELLVARDRAKVDLKEVIEAVRRAGFEAREK